MIFSNQYEKKKYKNIYIISTQTNKKFKKINYYPIKEGQTQAIIFKIFNINYSLKALVILFSIIIGNNKLNKEYIWDQKNKKYSSSYFSCFISMTKLENKYARELIEHY